jgi:hypothetical protein
MNIRFIASLSAMLFFHLGCARQKDLSRTAAVQQSGVIGQRIEIAQELDLFKDVRSHTLQLMRRDANTYGRGERIGVLPARSTLRISKVIQIEALEGMMLIFP